ncbi:MAG TPA: hypothetical protein VJY62_16415 [Bacteroidia bacterium]|nr:hypothetical protein [Bacteroidia bacterium]
MNRKISKKMSVTEQIKIIQGMMENMNTVDRQLMSDKLLTYLLFDFNEEAGTKAAGSETKKGIENSGLSEEELKLIKELAKRTEDLKNLLGDNPGLFR